MKKTLIMIALNFLLGLFGAQAQNLPKSGSNIKDNTLDQFQGTWVWNKGNEKVKIYLRKENVEMIKGITSDVLVGFHSFEKNGKVVETSLNSNKSDFNDKKWTLLISNNPNQSMLHGLLKDLSKDKTVDVQLVYNQSRRSLTLTLKDKEGLRVKKYESGFTLPQNIELIRE